MARTPDVMHACCASPSMAIMPSRRSLRKARSLRTFRSPASNDPSQPPRQGRAHPVSRAHGHAPLRSSSDIPAAGNSVWLSGRACLLCRPPGLTRSERLLGAAVFRPRSLLQPGLQDVPMPLSRSHLFAALVGTAAASLVPGPASQAEPPTGLILAADDAIMVHEAWARASAGAQPPARPMSR